MSYAYRLVSKRGLIRGYRDTPPNAEELEIARMDGDHYEALIVVGRLQAKERCTMGVGCEEAGTCYAAAHSQPERCERVLIIKTGEQTT